MAEIDDTLQGQHLTRVFGDGDEEVIALADVSMTLNPREITLLMGPSGSGKSTLLAVLSGLLEPSEGQVIALGRDLWSMSEEERRAFRLAHFGFIFQGYNLFPALTARQQLEIVLRWGMRESSRAARRRADEMLSVLGLGKRAAQRPLHLSGGEKQRVAVARALVKTPRFCFADEPTSSLDWEHGRQVVELLHDAAHNRNASVLIVTHDSRIIPYADRFYQLEDGRLHAASEVAALRAGSKSQLATGEAIPVNMGYGP